MPVTNNYFSDKGGKGSADSTKTTTSKAKGSKAKPAAAPAPGGDLGAVIAALSTMGGEDEERENEFLMKVGSTFIDWLDAKQEKKLRTAYKRIDDVLEKSNSPAAADAAFSDDMFKIFTGR